MFILVCFVSVLQVKKLEVLGYKPILFISTEQKKGFSAEVISSAGPFAKGPLQNILEKMTGLYEFFIKSKSFVCVIFIISHVSNYIFLTFL